MRLLFGLSKNFLLIRFTAGLERVLPPPTSKPPAAVSPGIKQEVKTETKIEPGVVKGTNGTNGASGASGSNGSTQPGPLHGMKFTIVGRKSDSAYEDIALDCC